MGSNTSTTALLPDQLEEFIGEETGSPKQKQRASSLKQHTSFKSNNSASDDDKEPNNVSSIMEKQPSILGFVGDLIGIKQTPPHHHHKAVRMADIEPHKNSESILSSPLRSANNGPSDGDIQPIFSSKSVFIRPRAKSYGSSLKNSVSSSNSVNSSISNNSILTRNQVHINSSYDNWNRDTICWEEFKRKSIERENTKKRVKDVSASWSPSTTSNESPRKQTITNSNPSQQQNPLSMSMNFSSSSSSPNSYQSSSGGASRARREGVVLAPITNRVGMEVERTGLGNFLKNLEQPSLLTQSIR